MEIATIINAHGNTELVVDTIMSIRKHVGQNILVVVDGAFWESWGKDVELPSHKICGLYHNYCVGPYRNVAFGLKQVRELFPCSDWYCYAEPDVLFASDAFKNDLHSNTWLAGNDYRDSPIKLSLIENILGCKIESTKYMLGCCMFYNKTFLRVLEGINFFERFLWMTNTFSQGFFPHYMEQGGYDLSEHLYPTLANHFGGKVQELAKWEGVSKSFHMYSTQTKDDGVWKGDGHKYALRWCPDLEEEEVHETASILHPIKNYNHPTRISQREKRNDRARV